MATSKKLDRAEVLEKIIGILESDTLDPLTALRQLGETLVKIAAALEGLSVGDARSVLRAVSELT